MEKSIFQLFDALRDIVNAPAPWREKKDEILGNATEEDKTNLGEFVTWFEIEQEDSD